MKCTGWDGPCNNSDAQNFRMNTVYTDEKLNWKILCPDCQKVCNKDWSATWKDYYYDIF